MSQVANSDMIAAPGAPSSSLTPLGGPGAPNGYPWQCCGALPAKIDPQNILNDGGKYVTLKDGRILEYFVYGSEKKDARIIVQLTGTGGTGKFFSTGKAPAKYNELNIRGIGITYPGHGYSTVNVGRRVIDFVSDCEEVFKVEGVDKFIVEGSSYGAPHAMALAWHYSKLDRILAMHLHVPYLSNELAREVTPDTLVLSNPSNGTTATLQTSCSPFCLTSLICCCCLPVCGPCMIPDGDYPGSGKLALQDIRRSAKHSVYGISFNNADDHCSNNWGFDAREIKLTGPQQVLITYAGDDQDVPPAHGKWLAEHFKATVNTKSEGVGHLTFAAAMLRGDMTAQLVKLIDGGSRSGETAISEASSAATEIKESEKSVTVITTEADTAVVSTVTEEVTRVITEEVITTVTEEVITTVASTEESADT